MLTCEPWRRTILVCVCGRLRTGWEETNHWPNVESTCERRWFGRTDIVTLSQTSKDIVDNCRNMLESRLSSGAVEKLPYSETLAQTDLHGPMIWKVMQRNAWNDTANWRTEQFNSCTKSQRHLKNKWDLLENWQKFAHKLFLNVHSWHVLEDPIFYGPWTNLHVLSPSGQKLVTKHWCVWSLTFFIRLRFCRRSWGFEIYVRWNIVHVRKSHVRMNKLDVQGTDFSFTQFYRSWSNFSDASLRMDGILRSRSLGLSDLKYFILHQTKPTKTNHVPSSGTHSGSMLCCMSLRTIKSC